MFSTAQHKTETAFINRALYTLVLCTLLVFAMHARAAASESIADGVASQSVIQASAAGAVVPKNPNVSSKHGHESVSVIAQVGSNNAAHVVQSRNKAVFSSGNYAAIYQNGNWNEANIIQSGGNNAGLIGQIGNHHQATIEQRGNSFDARINQTGYHSDIAISQSGSGLRSLSVGQASVAGRAAPVVIRMY
ncbi:hypothetical protein [uncultured Salinisphaera sp.]|uniref:hypothetical protein n=1 Tax=uncultured Salinisphaera sp. TaxID=359372 RepID=UPI0032B17197|tara:strand:- start:380 stop:952 length:573 start_codon:yes stop_codon:yes gene_type:complete